MCISSTLVERTQNNYVNYGKISVKTLTQIADTLHISIDWLLGRSSHMELEPKIGTSDILLMIVNFLDAHGVQFNTNYKQADIIEDGIVTKRACPMLNLSYTDLADFIIQWEAVKGMREKAGLDAEDYQTLIHKRVDELEHPKEAKRYPWESPVRSEKSKRLEDPNDGEEA